MRDTIEMAREAGAIILDGSDTTVIDRLVALVRADERERVMNEPLTKANWQRFEDEIRADEREACAKVCDELRGINWGPEQCATAIRARSNT
jgi:hypothetical protein